MDSLPPPPEAPAARQEYIPLPTRLVVDADALVVRSGGDGELSPGQTAPPPDPETSRGRREEGKMR